MQDYKLVRVKNGTSFAITPNMKASNQLDHFQPFSVPHHRQMIRESTSPSKAKT
jgi:hypothetical protein